MKACMGFITSGTTERNEHFVRVTLIAQFQGNPRDVSLAF